MDHVWTIVMAGGVGSRFWPMSRAARPKQLLDLFGDGPMLRTTVERVLPLCPFERQVLVVGELLRDAVRAILPEVAAANVLCEPVGRNTAPAIGWAARHILERDPDAVLMVLPADQHVADVVAYRAVCARALTAARDLDAIVTLGIPPTRPETGYGYIRRGEPLGDGVFRVAEFAEKPALATAAAYLADGGYVWNAGSFFMPARLFLSELARFEPALSSGLAALTPDNLHDHYPTLTRISVDYAVMERSERVVMVPGSFGWSDVGSWRSLWDFRGPDATTFAHGDVIELDGGGNVLVAADGGLVAAVGVRDLVVVHTRDATLVCPREEAQRAKDVVTALEAAGRKEHL